MTISPYAIPGIQRDDYFIQKACHVFGVKKQDVLSDSRKRELAQCRQILMYYFITELKRTQESVAQLFNKTTRGSVTNAIKNVSQAEKYNKELFNYKLKFEESLND